MTTTDTEDQRPLAADGTYNLRVVPPFAAGGSTLRSGALLRSDALDRLTDRGRAAVGDLGLRLVVDLRTADEVAAAPTLLPDVPNVHCPIFDSGAPTVAPGSGITLAGIYDLMVDDRGPQLAEAVRLIASGDGEPVLVHCTAGKDRTGLVVALALLAVGVDRGLVVRDYAATAANLAGVWAERMLERLRLAGIPGSRELTEILTGSPAAALDRVIDRWESEWGSASAYLAANGFTPTDHDRLTHALLAPAPAAASAND